MCNGYICKYAVNKIVCKNRAKNALLKFVPDVQL